MMPLYPASTFVELANESARYARRSRPDGVDTFSDDDALAPDPLFMGLRHLAHAGPIGAFVNAIDRWLEARDERRYGTSDAPTNDAPQHIHRAGSDASQGTADPDERIAA